MKQAEKEQALAVPEATAVAQRGAEVLDFATLVKFNLDGLEHVEVPRIRLLGQGAAMFAMLDEHDEDRKSVV